MKDSLLGVESKSTKKIPVYKLLQQSRHKTIMAWNLVVEVEILRLVKTRDLFLRLNGVSHRVSVGKEEKSETFALGLSNRLKGKVKTSQRSSSNEGRRKIKSD